MPESFFSHLYSFDCGENKLSVSQKHEGGPTKISRVIIFPLNRAARLLMVQWMHFEHSLASGKL